MQEVESALGPLAGPPYRTGNNGPDKAGSKCVYATKDLRSMSLDVDWTGGPMLMKMLGMPAAVRQQTDAGLKSGLNELPLPGGVKVSGEWDEAKAIGCCIIDTVTGESYVGINFESTRLSPEQATALLNSAIKRLGSPLKDIDGSAGVAAAKQRESVGAGRPKPVPACTLVTLEDATALMGQIGRAHV